MDRKIQLIHLRLNYKSHSSSDKEWAKQEPPDLGAEEREQPQRGGPEGPAELHVGEWMGGSIGLAPARF